MRDDVARETLAAMMARCVSCNQEFDQEKVEHLPELAANKRWTCSLVCEKRLELRGRERSAQLEELKRRAKDEESFDGPSEAEKARAALAGLGRVGSVGSAPPEDDSEEMTSDSSIDERLGAVSTLAGLAATMSGAQDRYVLAGIASGFLNSCMQELETGIPDDGGREPAEA